MTGLAEFRAVPAWFVVLPDCESAGLVSAALQDHATRAIRHPSGRPWVLGRWAEGTVTVGQAGRTTIALMGQHAATVADLADAADRIETITDIDRFAAS